MPGPTSVNERRSLTPTSNERQPSLGSTWTVGGLAAVPAGVSNGRGGMIGAGTNAPLYSTTFSASFHHGNTERDKHEGRLATALGFDRARRVLEFADPSSPCDVFSPVQQNKDSSQTKTEWKGTEWVIGTPNTNQKNFSDIEVLSSAPFKVLDAPNLRDDFYCSVLAFSLTSRTLAVGLGTFLYAWSEKQDVRLLDSGTVHSGWLTSLAFSSNQGCKSILGYGRNDGILGLLSLYDRAGTDQAPQPRFEVQHSCPISCLSWKPTVTLRPSLNPITHGMLVGTEDLIVGEENGMMYCYYVEWPANFDANRSGWPGAMVLRAKISIHTQQICGLAWSVEGDTFASGGNDNLCCLFKTSAIPEAQPKSGMEIITGLDDDRHPHMLIDRGRVPVISAGGERHRWMHAAAVKAIAFCPWRDGLVATGGGSNDKCIHFYHAPSGACLATINVDAQVTSLIWSTTRREIAATFGYAQPEHPYRIAVFSWPECKQVAAIPWDGEMRALCAVAYPGSPTTMGVKNYRSKKKNFTQDGCIVVAASDESIKFHEVWSVGRKAAMNCEGLLGGSDILEGLEGIDKQGEVIR